MLIEIERVKPKPIPQRIIDRSEIWGRKIKIEPNSFNLISAQSGMGKSTLLHILFGLRHDYLGEVKIDGKHVRPKNWKDWEVFRRERISLLFQDLRLFAALSARENIELIPLNNPTAPSIDEMAKHLGMTEFLDRPMNNLSHGQRQRVALIRALRKPFELLLLDEPFSHLDKENQSRACSLVDEVTRSNKAGLIVSSLGGVPALAFKNTFAL